MNPDDLDDLEAELRIVRAVSGAGDAGGAGLAVYLRIVHAAFAGVTRTMFGDALPALEAALGGPAALDDEIDAFVRDAGTPSHHLRDVPHAIFAWGEPRWKGRVPSEVLDAARAELAVFAVAAAPDGPATAGDVEIDRPIVFLHATRVVASGAKGVLLFRDPEDDVVRRRDLDPFEYAILSRLVAGERLGAAIVASSAAAHTGRVAALLAELAEDGVVRGGGPP